MSAHHLRKDKTCLNCGHEVPERFCTHCGQENTEPHETFGHLASHFFQDITHYDSKAWVTIRDLLFKPGLLTKLYMSGKRQSFVNPVRMYIFISFVFFLVMALVQKHHDPYEIEKPGNETIKEAYNKSLNQRYERKRDSLNRPEVEIMSANERANVMLDVQLADIARQTLGDPETAIARFDSLQQSLPRDQRYSSLHGRGYKLYLYLNAKYGDNLGRAIVDKFEHNLPKLMFLLLPLFAVFLKWVYSRKKWFYADHAIFTIHFHTFLFILGAVTFLLNYWLHTEWFTLLAMLASAVYFVLALKNVYGQSLGKSFFKALLVFVAYGLSIILVLLLYVVGILALI